MFVARCKTDVLLGNLSQIFYYVAQTTAIVESTMDIEIRLFKFALSLNKFRGHSVLLKCAGEN